MERMIYFTACKTHFYTIMCPFLHDLGMKVVLWLSFGQCFTKLVNSNDVPKLIKLPDFGQIITSVLSYENRCAGSPV